MLQFQNNNFRYIINMNIKDFTKDGKLIIPEEEIDNIYIWTKITSTQDVLMSSEVCHRWMKKSFEADTARYIELFSKSCRGIDRSTYQLSDFITFSANHSNLFYNKRSCFVVCSDIDLLRSFACYCTHIYNMFTLEDTMLSDFIFNKIDEPERIKTLMSSEMLMISAIGILPDHKYKQMILNSLIHERTKPNFVTLVHAINKTTMLYDNDENLAKQAESRGVKDINPLIKVWKERRTFDYKKLMSTWYSMLADSSCLVYSKEEPTERLRRRERYM